MYNQFNSKREQVEIIINKMANFSYILIGPEI